MVRKQQFEGGQEAALSAAEQLPSPPQRHSKRGELASQGHHATLCDKALNNATLGKIGDLLGGETKPGVNFVVMLAHFRRGTS